MFLRRPVYCLLGLLALSALLVPASATATGASVRAQVMRAATPPVGGSVTPQELPGCANPSEPFAGVSQGCDIGADFFARGPRQTTSLDGTFARGPRQTTSLDGTFNRGPRQTTSLDGSIDPVTGSLAVTSASRVDKPSRGFLKDLSPEPTWDSALAGTTGVLGYGWSFPYSMSLRVYRGTATITQENGSKVVFKLGADKQFHAAPRVIASFQQSSNGSYTLTRGSSRSSCPSYLLQSCVSFTFRNGHLSRISRKSPGACKSTEVCGNGIVDITHDSAGRPTSAHADTGESLAFAYAGGHLTSITGAGGLSEKFTYDAHGNLGSVTDPKGNTTQYTYDGAHRLTTVRDPLGRATRYQYNAAGRVSGVTDPRGNKTTYLYGSNHTTTITSPEGRRVVIAYQDSTVVDLRAVGTGGTPPLAEWTFAYDPRTLAETKTVDPDLHVTTAVSDVDGLPLSVTDALGKTASFTYSDTGRRSSVTDPLGVRTTSTYDENGNVVVQSTPVFSDPNSKQLMTYLWSYDHPAQPGELTSTVDPLGNETDYTYDSHGNVTSATDPLGNTWTYSRFSLPACAPAPGATVTDPLGHTTSYRCDKNGNVLTATDGNGAKTTNTYDADDELISSTDPAGRTTTYSYNLDGQLTAVHMPGGTTSRATYGADGELTSTIDPAGGKRQFTYDQLGRMATSTDQLGRTTTLTHDGSGNVTASTDAMGVTASNTYDGDNRLVSTSYSDGATPTVSYAYDADGRRTSMTDGTGTTTYQYDSLGRVTRVVDGAGQVVRHGYDLAGHPIELQYPNGEVVAMRYDGDGQMTGVSDWLGHTTQFTYDGAGNRVRRHTLDVRLAQADAKTTWEYNAANQVLHITDQAADGSTYASFDYTRAVDGRITAVHATGLGQPDQTYGYDPKGRLGSENANLLTFDSRDNVTRLSDGSTLSYDAADQLTSMQSGGLLSTFTYDADGRRTSWGSPASLHVVETNGAGDMTSFSLNGATTSYAVNGDGLRVSSSAGGVTHQFVWDTAADRGVPTNGLPSNGLPTNGLPSNGVFRTRDTFRQDILDQSGRLAQPLLAGVLKPIELVSDGTHSFIYGPDGLPIEQIDNSDHALFLDEDAQGSVRLLTDADGTVEGTASYDAFGNQVAQSGASSPFGYDGMYVDAESGLYALGGGVYDPATGQGLVYFNPKEYSISKSVQWEPHKSPGLWGSGPSDVFAVGGRRRGVSRHNPDELVFNRVAGIDESCQGQDLCTLSPYALGGGDPVNSVVRRGDEPGPAAAGEPTNDVNDVNH